MNIRSESTSNKIIGVYTIRNKKNSQCYIGSSSDHIPKRWKLHELMLRENRHHSIVLQRAWNKYGKDNFIFEILEHCSPDECIKKEQYYLDTLVPIIIYANLRGLREGENIQKLKKKK